MELPFVLAGPVLKRSEPGEIWIWIAFSKSVESVYPDSKLEILFFDHSKAPAPIDALTSNIDDKLVGAGYYPADEKSNSFYFRALDNLHIYLLHVTPKYAKKDFSTYSLLSYELFVKSSLEFLNSKGKSEKKQVRRGLHEHLYAKSKDWGKWRRSENLPTPIPPGLVGYRAARGEFEGWTDLDKLDDSDTALTADQLWSMELDVPDLQPYLDTMNLKDYRNLFERDKPITSISLALPCVRIGKQREERAVVWSGSCFKLGGAGESATFAMFDDRLHKDESRLVRAIESDRKNNLFPQALVLTGDQIYADDVTFTLSTPVSILAKLLHPHPEKAGEKFPDLNILRGRDRKKIVENSNEFTPFTVDGDIPFSVGAYNHLLSFSEYCAYYLLHLNAALWPSLKKNAIKKIAMNVYSNTKPMKEVSGREIVAEEIKILTSVQHAIRSFSIVKSCVPTYELCDDHDVTDDWFFDGKWMAGLLDPFQQFQDEVKHSELGCQIIANAIHAYALFQGVGNNPSKFVARLTSSPLIDPPTKRKGGQEIAQFNRLIAWLSEGDWSFTLPLTVGKGVCLDTRSQRFSLDWYDAVKECRDKKKKGSDSPWHKDYYKLSEEGDTSLWASHQRDSLSGNISQSHDYKLKFKTLLYRDEHLNLLLDDVKETNGPLILFTPAPICEIDKVTEVKKAIETLVSDYRTDGELWRNNLSNFYRLVSKLLKESVSDCLIVSGDVHYSYRREMEIVPVPVDYESAKEMLFEALPTINRKRFPISVRLNQVVCSALKNEWEYDGTVAKNASPTGKYLKPSGQLVCFNKLAKDGYTYSVNYRKAWDSPHGQIGSDHTKFLELTIPLSLVGETPDTQSRAGNYLFANNFVEITIDDSNKAEIKFFKVGWDGVDHDLANKTNNVA